MQLFGSVTSPYVRRTRLLLVDVDYEFRDLAIYGADQAELARHNPTLKIPTLIDGETTLFDSRVIQRYLAAQRGQAPLSWRQENQLTVIDGANDAFVALLLAARSGLDPSQDAMIYNRHRERIRTCLDWLETAAADGAFDHWRYPAICVYCMLDWVVFRELHDMSGHRALAAVCERHGGQPGVAATDPRQAV
ncbi:glutathione S-transferase family protein [Salinisphaera sp. SWV1]|uniref:glutathione S-transferase family protein n=1 Tax=Salinisphaera sp. SWV1 TaxID=3454139 RepID=UPI003F82EFBF